MRERREGGEEGRRERRKGGRGKREGCGSIHIEGVIDGQGGKKRRGRRGRMREG